MSLSVSDYVSMAMNDVEIALSRKKRKFLRYFLYSVASFIGKLFFLSYPLFAFADHHISNQIRENRNWQLLDAFEDTNDQKRYWTTVKYALLNHIVHITGFLMIAGVVFVLMRVASSITDYYEPERQYLMFVAQIISGALVVSFLFSVRIHLGPMIYLLRTSDDLSLSEAFKHSAIIMEGQGKIKLFHMQFRSLSKVLFWGLLCAGFGYLSYTAFSFDVFLVIAIILGFLFLRLVSRQGLVYRISASNLYTDLIKEVAYDRLSEHDMDRMTGSTLRKKDILKTLFDGVPIDNDHNVPDAQHDSSGTTHLDQV